MSKRILSLVLTLALVLGSFSMAFADTATTTSKTMTDVEGTNYEKAVATLGKLKVLEGYTDGTFKPGNTITRAEFAAVASRIRGLETAAQNSKGATEFKDVPASHWASGYVNVASKNGLIKGMGNGQFAPEAPITYEQAITMIVRALGYEYAAQSLGGYPVGYLSVASQEQLLKGINEGAQGQPATRGLVALLLNNALDIPKMIQVGYGDQAKWIQSGTENTDKKFLFEDLGLVQVSKVIVTKADSKKQTVTIESTKETPESFTSRGLKADKDFDYVGLKGMRVTAWFDDKAGELIVAKEDGAYKAKYDVVESTTRKNEVSLVNEGEKYDVNEKATLKLDGDNVTNLVNYDGSNTYAKVIIDEYGDVREIEAYDLTDEIVVKEVSKDLIKGYDRKEISESNDYTIIKNGKEISAADLKDKDFLIYDSSEEVAVVITDIREGKLDTVYKEGFKFEGKTYDNNITKYGDVEYIVEDNLEAVTQEVLEEMQSNGEVKVYFSFDGKPLFIDGKAEEVASNYVMLTSDTKEFNNRGTKNRTFDVLNSEGKTVEYSVKKEDIEKDDKLFKGTLDNWDSSFKEEAVAKITTDANNKLTKVELVASAKTIDSDNNLETNDTYFRGSRLQSNAVVFMRDGESEVKDYSVIKWADASKDFKKVVKGNVYVDDKDNVVAIFAEETDGDTQVKDVVGVLKKSKETTSKSRYDVIVEVNGKEVEYQAKKFDGIESLEDQVNKVVVLKVTKEGNELRDWDLPAAEDVKVVTVKSATSGTLTDTNNNNYDIEGQYYNNSLKSTIKAGDVKDKQVTLYFQPGSSRYVQVVQEGAGSGAGLVSTDGVVTYINTTDNVIQLNNGSEQKVIGAGRVQLDTLAKEANYFTGSAGLGYAPVTGTNVEAKLTTNDNKEVTGIELVKVTTKNAGAFNKAAATSTVKEIVVTGNISAALTVSEIMDINLQGNTVDDLTLNTGAKEGTININGTNDAKIVKLTVDGTKLTVKNNVEVTTEVIINAVSVNSFYQNAKAEKIVWNAAKANLHLNGAVKIVEVKSGKEVAIKGADKITTTLIANGKVDLDVAVADEKVTGKENVSVNDKPVLDATTLESAKFVDAVPAVDNKQAEATGEQFKVVAANAKAGKAGDGYKVVVVNATEGTESDIKVVIAEKTITATIGKDAVSKKVSDVVSAINGGSGVSDLVVVSAVDTKADETAADVTLTTSGGVDVKAKVNAKLVLTFSNELKAETISVKVKAEATTFTAIPDAKAKKVEFDVDGKNVTNGSVISEITGVKADNNAPFEFDGNFEITK